MLFDAMTRMVAGSFEPLVSLTPDTSDTFRHGYTVDKINHHRCSLFPLSSWLAGETSRIWTSGGTVMRLLAPRFL